MTQPEFVMVNEDGTVVLPEDAMNGSVDDRAEALLNTLDPDAVRKAAARYRAELVAKHSELEASRALYRDALIALGEAVLSNARAGYKSEAEAVGAYVMSKRMNRLP